MFKKIAIAVTAFLLVFFLFFNFVLEGLVKNKLSGMVSETFGNYYELTFDNNSTRLSLAGFSIGFTGVEVSSDTTNVQMMSKFSPLFFKASEFSLEHISVMNLLFKSDIDIDQLRLLDPELVFLLGTKKAPTSVGVEQQSAGFLKELEIERLDLKGGSATFISMNNPEDTIYAGNNLKILGRSIDVLIGDEGLRPQGITLDQFTVDLNNALYNPKASPHRYEMAQMSLNYQEGFLDLNEISLIPKRSMVAMTEDEKYQKTMFDINIDHFILEEIDFDSLKNTSALRAASGTLTGAHFSLLRNANHPLAPTDKTLMHQSLAESSFPIDIDSLLIKDALIDYQLIPKGKTKQGQVLLQHMNGYLTKLYSEEHKRDTMELLLTSDFLANGQFTFAAQFPLKGVPNHQYHGHISALPFTDLNTIVTPMVGLQLNEGLIEDIYFTGTCTGNINQGEMIFDYDNLKLQVNNEKKGKKNWVMTDIGNLIIRHKSKKDKDGRSKAVEFYYERPAYQGHIGFYLNGLLDGMMKNLLPGPAYRAAIKGMKPSLD